MKRLFRNVIMAGIFVGTLSLTSCGDEKKNEEVDNDVTMPVQNEMHMQEDDMQRMGDNQQDMIEHKKSQFKDPKIGMAFGRYNQVMMELVSSDAEGAQEGGQLLVKALQETEGNNEALEAAQKIAQSNNLNVQRTAFSDLSNAMESILRGSMSSGELYKQYCPMAFEGRGGYWISGSEMILNPYYGDKMLKCGSVKDTIK